MSFNTAWGEVYHHGASMEVLRSFVREALNTRLLRLKMAGYSNLFVQVTMLKGGPENGLMFLFFSFVVGLSQSLLIVSSECFKLSRFVRFEDEKEKERLPCYAWRSSG